MFSLASLYAPCVHGYHPLLVITINIFYYLYENCTHDVSRPYKLVTVLLSLMQALLIRILRFHDQVNVQTFLYHMTS